MKSSSVFLLVGLLLTAVSKSLNAQEQRAREVSEWEALTAPVMTRWAAAVSPENVHPEYPRPQMVRAEWMNLNGLWEFEPADGADEDPPFRRPLDGSILVPFPVESALSGVMEHHDRIWYRRTFEVPEGWNGKRVLLHFGAVDWEARVWVNGKPVGEHRGGYDPFSFDITDGLRDDVAEQVIVVGVWDPTDASTQPRGKQVRRPEGIWYTPTTGIWQTVWLEPVAINHIRAAEVMSDIRGRIVIALDLCLTDPPWAYTIEATVRDGAEVVGRGETNVAAVEGESIATGSISLQLVNEPKLWSPEEPHLYDLELVVRRLDPLQRELDRVNSYFGVREISVAHDESGTPRLFLNGAPCFMIGTLDQGFWPDGLYTAPSDEALRFDIEQTKRLGFNTIRKHVKVESARWYYWCDRLGMLVWQDMPSGDAYIGPNDPDIVRTDESTAQFERELRSMIDSLRNHPSIIMWVPFNEGWGQFGTGRITDLIREIDPTRLVNSASGWTDRGTGDVHDIHAYPGPAAPPVEEKRAGVLGEFGGLGLAIEGHTWSDTTWGYRGMQDEEELARRYASLLRRVYELKESSGLSAAIYTQITDVETETNGLLTYDRSVVKVDPARIARANRGEFPEFVTLVSCARDNAAIDWHYALEEPPEEWTSWTRINQWRSGVGGFGTPGTPGAIVGTEWSTPDIWIHRVFSLEEVPAGEVRLLIHHDEDAMVYINGVLAAELTGYTTMYEDVPISAEARAALRSAPARGGVNTLAIHCRQTRGGQYIDAGLVVVTEPEK